MIRLTNHCMYLQWYLELLSEGVGGSNPLGNRLADHRWQMVSIQCKRRVDWLVCYPSGIRRWQELEMKMTDI